jgi:SAM-dependent methyltransferase
MTLESAPRMIIKTLKWLWTGPKLIKLRILWNNLSPVKMSGDVKKLIPLFAGRKGVRIGGKLSDKFEECLSYATKVIDVNIVRDRLRQSVDVDYLTDATNLYFAKDGEFDFVCSSHVLEHIANPIKALYEWKRVIGAGGIIYCGVPDKRFTFDHRRQRTPLNHLIDDYQKDVDQSDTTHIQDLIDNWDERLDSCWDNRQQHLEHIRTNPISGIHHHVWIKGDVTELFKYVHLEVVYAALNGNTIHIVGKKSSAQKEMP